MISAILSGLLFLAPIWSPLLANALGFAIDVKYILGLPLPIFGFIVWMIVGLVVYFAYSRSHSTVGKEEARRRSSRRRLVKPRAKP